MAAVELSYRAIEYDLVNRTARQVFLVGEAFLTGLGVGGGPMPPGPGAPDHIWGGGNVPMPSPPIANVPGAPGYRPPGDHIWGGGNVPMPSPPIYFPPQVPPGMQPPTPPQPGDPTTSVPGDWPVQPITPPPYIVVQYPGIGPVVVAPPETATPT